ncbi:hypothetical protein EI982_16655 [Haloplanus rallus]|uniref:Uncharacterized protein n=1 Tax=Haloplanus rallus TaxID=1816183 RepID=A0A6B9FHJ8_9EURY|nr:hypothetical protein [Haloplanus rallus]QGX96293.1 hypothetical protein EI982_16655 [Haloplanus rallus]
MSLRVFDPLHVVAAHLAVLVAVLHLALGVTNWVTYLAGGIVIPPDVRWPLFVLSGVAIVAGVVAAIAGADRRPLYAAGVGLMVVYVVGYFAWHVGGHRPLLFVGPGTHHHGSTFEYLLAHVFAGPVEFLALASETALAGLLGYLYYHDR